LAHEVAEQCNLSERKVRDDFIRIINEKVTDLKKDGLIIGENYSEGEDWLLATSSLDSVFRAITCLLNHNTEYRNCEKIPLEIGIGVIQHDKWAKLEGNKLIEENSTIDFLKKPIIDYYRKWYKRTYSTSIKSTFIVFSEKVYDEMEPFDKEFCNKIDYEDSAETGKSDRISFWVADSHKLLQRGRTLDFLSKIGKAESSWYCRIDRIFVPPSDYQDILQLLEKNQVVFLVGDPEIGKTYTAVRILWEYYCKGYQPVWHPGAELQERLNARQLISEATVNDNSITYFEDPFGKIRFEDREELKRRIGSFLDRIKNLNARVVITSREEVFKEFEKQKLTQSNLRALSVSMHLMKPAYDEEKMQTILLDWATEFKCKWLLNAPLKSLVINEVTTKISTPLGVKDFALASKDVEEPEIIKLLIKQKSKEVREAFAEEIAKMEREKILFLSLTYMLYLRADEVESVYQRTCQKLGLDCETKSFSCLQEEFSYRIKPPTAYTKFEFTHPSYEEGLVSSWNRIEVKPFFMKILNEVVKDELPAARGSCGLTLLKNFSDISFKDEAKQLIGSVLHDKSSITRYGIAQAFQSHFDEIPSDIALEYLEIMSHDRNGEIRATAVSTSGRNLEKIPLEKALKYISQGLEDRAAWVRLAAVGQVRHNMELFPEEVVIKAISCCKELCDYTGWFISDCAWMTYSTFEKEFEKLKSGQPSSKRPLFKF
jgi:hypothetical protein